MLRRVGDDPVVVLVAVPSGTTGDQRLGGTELPTLTLGLLPVDDAVGLLNSAAPDLSTEDAAAVVLRESAWLPPWKTLS